MCDFYGAVVMCCENYHQENLPAKSTPDLCGGLLSLTISPFKSTVCCGYCNTSLKSSSSPFPMLYSRVRAGHSPHGFPSFKGFSYLRLVKYFKLLHHYSSFSIWTFKDTYLAGLKIIKLWPLVGIPSLCFEGCAYILRLLPRQTKTIWTD